MARIRTKTGIIGPQDEPDGAVVHSVAEAHQRLCKLIIIRYLQSCSFFYPPNLAAFGRNYIWVKRGKSYSIQLLRTTFSLD